MVQAKETIFNIFILWTHFIFLETWIRSSVCYQTRDQQDKEMVILKIGKRVKVGLYNPYKALK
jgi:hypothetical protein